MTVYSVNEKAKLYVDLKNLILLNIFLALLIPNCFVLV